MKLPRDVSGARLVQVLCKHYGYRQIHQVGSHVVLETASPRPVRGVLDSHVALAEQYALTAYDAAYLDLALRKGVPLATHDKALKAAAAKAGVKLAAAPG